MFRKITLVLLLALSVVVDAQEVTKLAELEIAENGLYFDGQRRTNADLNTDEPGFDYFFGRRITPHGDCIKQFGDYVFMSWWAGGEENKHVMLSRYNIKTEVLEEIEFPHTHVGMRSKYPHVGDSHNTIAVAISPLDSTVHLLYDMHSYSKQDFPDTYFNYNISKKGGALVPDGEFNRDVFNPKQTYLNQIYNYSDITYPNFFLNDRDELFVWFREGGNNNGAYKFAKYNGTIWSNFTDFNVLNARGRGNAYNWGLYGDLKYVNGKFRVGFVKRMSNNNDKYVYNNGWHYGYSNDPDGKKEWFNHSGQPLSLPVIDPAKLFFYEPGNLVTDGGANSVTISSGADWTVSDNESIHFITNKIRSKAGENVDVHGYKKPGESEFTISTEFPGGTLYEARGNHVFLMDLNSSGRPYVYVTEGGTNDWELLYEASDGKRFRHMNVLIEDDKLFMYLMESSSGDAQPIHLQVYDLGLPEVVEVTPLAAEVQSPIEQVAIYPNPASEWLFVSHASQEPVSYRIYDMAGVEQQNGQLTDFAIDVSTLKTGLYLLNVQSADLNETIRFKVK
ncbi:MAG: BNR-4 repeat-containing protein [Cyclobacteriaceae bacterium]